MIAEYANFYEPGGKVAYATYQTERLRVRTRVGGFALAFLRAVRRDRGRYRDRQSIRYPRGQRVRSGQGYQPHSGNRSS